MVITMKKNTKKENKQYKSDRGNRKMPKLPAPKGNQNKMTQDASIDELILDLNIKIIEIVRDLMVILGIVCFLFVYNSL